MSGSMYKPRLCLHTGKHYAHVWQQSNIYRSRGRVGKNFLTRKFPIKLIRCRIEAFMKVEERRNVTSLSKFVYQKLIYQSSITKLAIFYITVIYQNYNMPKVYEKFLRPQILVLRTSDIHA